MQQQNHTPTNKLVIGVTGGIGSGKSVATDWFAAQGIVIIDADVIAREVVAKGQPALLQIQRQFGDKLMTASGELDRGAMRAHVFAHPEELKKLEAIIHPAVRAQAQQQLAHASSAYVMLSAPLLLEGANKGAAVSLASLCQRILVIDVPEQLQLERAAQRDQQSHEKIRAIMDKQLSRQHRLQQADDVVVNEGTLEELYAKLAALHAHYLQLAQHSS